MGVIGEAVVVLRPDAAGFGTSSAKAIDAELAGQDVFGAVDRSAGRTAQDIEDRFGTSATRIGDSMEKGTSRVAGLFKSLGNSAASFGLPFSGALSRVGSKIDETSTKGQHLFQTVSTLGGATLAVGAAGFAAIAAESVHLATGLQAADAQIASHENISVAAANNIGKAFLSTAGTVPFSANELAASFAPVSGQLEQIEGHALTAGQTLKFMSATGDLAEATNSNLASTTSTVSKIMQAFQIPLKGTVGLTNDLFNTARVTGVGVDSLGSVIDRLKSRLGIAAPTVQDLSTLLVDLNEHGIQGSRGLLVVNSAITKLLQTVPTVDTAAAKAANSLSTKLGNAATTTATDTQKLTDAQNAAATSVANAQEKLVEVQDKIAASNTASAPTTSQQIALQNAQTAVTNAQAAAAVKVQSAQNTLNIAQQKAGQIQESAALSTNKQVAAMQELGLQVYDSSGKFVGMRDIIAQLQPKLAGMTQEQQLATTSQIFGASASKALLTTILAGPAAYDKASKAVTDSSTAHAGAEKQAQTLSRELDVVKSSVIDEGDKLGIFLIPKLEDLAKWTAEDVRWLEKHKTIAEALGILLGGAAAVGVGVFAVNMGVKLVGSVRSAGQAVSNLSQTVLEKLGIIDRKTEDTDGVQRTSTEQFQTAADQISEAIDLASRNIVYALGQVDATIEGLVTTISTSATKIDGSFTTITEGATTASTETETAMDGLVTSVTDSGLAIIESNSKVAASFEEIGAGATTGAGEAGAAEAGLATKAEAGAGEAGLAGAAGAGEAGAASLGSSVLPAAIAGFTSFTLTTQALNSNFLGLGSAVKGAASGIANFLGVGPKQAGAPDANNLLTRADIPYLQEIAAGVTKGAYTAAEAKEVLEQKFNVHTFGAAGIEQASKAQSSGLQAKLTTVAQLQQAAYLQSVAHGANSSQAKAALQSLYATESKFLPEVSKDESTKQVNQTLFTTTLAIAQLKSQQAKLASEGTAAETKTHIQQLKDQLKTQTAAGASETTLKDTRNQITQAQNHLNQLNSVAGKISRDETTIKTAAEQKASIEKVNTQMQQLRQEIATMPPPKQVASGTPKLKVTKG